MRKIIFSILLLSAAHILPAQIFDELLSKAEDIAVVKPLLPCWCEDRSQVDLSANMPPVQDQGHYNDCVGFALGYACRSYYHRQVSNVSYYKGNNELDSSHLVSPYFIYAAKMRSPDTGINLLDAFNYLRDVGTCTWDMDTSISKPTEEQISAKITHQLRAYTYNRLGYDYGVSMGDIKSALKCGDPVVAAVNLDETYFYTEGYSGPAHALWQKAGAATKSHAVVIVGYDDINKCFKFMNSFGTNWGDGGFGKISYGIAPKVIIEAYVLKPEPPFYDLADAGIGKDPKKATKGSASQKVTIDLAVDSFVLDHLSTSIEDQDNNSIRVSAVMSMNDPSLGKLCSDSKSALFVRIFVVSNDGKIQPMLSSDTAHRLGNGQAAYRAERRDGALCSWYADIPVASLNIRKGKGKASSKNYRPVTTKLRAEPVLYIGRDPVSAGKTVDFAVNK